MKPKNYDLYKLEIPDEKLVVELKVRKGEDPEIVKDRFLERLSLSRNGFQFLPKKTIYGQLSTTPKSSEEAKRWA